jgi:hypothetical protein
MHLQATPPRRWISAREREAKRAAMRRKLFLMICAFGLIVTILIVRMAYVLNPQP